MLSMSQLCGRLTTTCRLLEREALPTANPGSIVTRTVKAGWREGNSDMAIQRGRNKYDVANKIEIEEGQCSSQVDMHKQNVG
jgi:hypothetical protein